MFIVRFQQKYGFFNILLDFSRASGLRVRYSDIFVPLNVFINLLNKLIMNKAELIDAMAAAANLSKADAKRALDAFVDVSTGALKSGDRISLVGFGSFSVSDRKERNGRNPKTGAVIKIAAKKSVRFKAGAELSGKVN
jgi:DNA-binding protein HU-beta